VSTLQCNSYTYADEQVAQVRCLHNASRLCVCVCACARAGVHVCVCVHEHCMSSVGAQTARPIETQIGTNTHWGNRHKLWEMAARSSRASAKRENEREAREYMNGTWRRNRRERAHIVKCGAKKGNNVRNLREYMNGTCREHEARVCGISDRQFAVACGACM
jgi:hypothetical protein